MKSIFCLILCLYSINVFAQGSNSKLEEDEIRDSEKIEFQNKNRKKAAYETRFLHESIGKRLAVQVSKNPEEIQFLEGVSVVRVPSSEKNKFGGDIMYLDESTRFGHVHSLQRVLSGYIQTAFNYTSSKADILANYVLYYNGMHRSDLRYFESKYTSTMIKRLSARNVGIAVKYKDWPGKTEIVIPIEKNVLKEFDKDVTLDELEKEVNKVIDEKKGGDEERKKFTEFKNEKFEDEKKEITLKKEELENQEEEIGNKQKKIEDKLAELKKDPEKNKDQIAKLEKEKEALEKKKAESTQKKEDLIEREEKITGKTVDRKEEKPVAAKEEKPAAKTETKPVPEKKESENVALMKEEKSTGSEEKKPAEKKADEKKSEEVKKDPAILEKELADTKKELDAKKEEERKKAEFSQNVVEGRIIFIKPMTYIEGQCNNEIHLLDPLKDDFVYTSEYNKICGKTFKDFGGNILVVGFKGNKDEIRLVILSKKDLKQAGNSEVNVYQKTPIEIAGEFLYAIENEDGKYYLSRFDKNLKRVLRSSEEVNPDAIITFYGKKIYLSGKNENGQVEFKIFNKEDLKFIKKTQA